MASCQHRARPTSWAVLHLRKSSVRPIRRSDLRERSFRQEAARLHKARRHSSRDAAVTAMGPLAPKDRHRNSMDLVTREGLVAGGAPPRAWSTWVTSTARQPGTDEE